MSKSVTLKVGVEKNLRELKADIPDNTPKPWDGGDELKFIGGRSTRTEGKDKVTGRAKYTFDIQLPGMLHGYFLRSHFPAGVIRKIDISKAENYPGVKSVILIQDKLPMIIRFAGQEICAIAAETAHQAHEAAKLISIEYDTRKFVLTAEQAKSPKSPVVFDSSVESKTSEGDAPEDSGNVSQKGNIRGPKVSGNLSAVENALRQSDVVIEATYRTQVQTHSAMETHGVVAKWEGDQLTVWASTQGVFSVQSELAGVFQIPRTQVRVLTEHMGGGFGAKFGAGIYGIMAAKLAKKTQAPVRFMLDRKSEHLAVGNRPDSTQTVKLGASQDGSLKAIKLVSYGTAGVGTGAGTSGPAKNIYFKTEHIYTEESDIFTNAGPGAAFRAPGHPQGAFAMEQAIDEMAYKLNIDPLEFRKKNTLYDEVRQAEYAIGAKKFGWDKRKSKPGADSGPIKRGVGIANSVWYYIYGTGFQASIQVTGDGSVELTNGVQDIGGGIKTVVAMVVAEELGLKPTDIIVKIGDSNYGLGPASGGSQTTAGITPAVRNAAYLAKMKMFDIAAPLLKTTVDQLALADGRIFIQSDTTKGLTWKQVASKIVGEKFTVTGERFKDHLQAGPFIAGVQFADVEVDTETGVVKVKRIVAVHDCGRPMNRLTLESQINGGIIQGVSYALFENRLLDAQTGIMVNPNLEQYKIAGSMDIPEIESVVIDVNRGQSSTGAMGIGEPATIPTAAAIANAVFHATGVRVRELPMTPAVVFKAIKGA
ncbi:xanthine dehydrogenase family protein molybdopterin-binding subunit [bacterium]|nr:MAG: xanthine dehydrogenase family protein molybdopterin-binding subunit [bacterium]